MKAMPLDHPFYDTQEVSPNSRVGFFGNSNVGDPHLTNLQIPGELARGGYGLQEFAITSVGLRVLGATRTEEDQLLDFLLADVAIADHSMLQLLGTHTSMLRHACTDAELRAAETRSAIPPVPSLVAALAEAHGYTGELDLSNEGLEVLMDWLEEAGLKERIREIRKAHAFYTAQRHGCGYRLARPLVVPARQFVRVWVTASARLRETVALRVHLFGLLRELPRA